LGAVAGVCHVTVRVISRGGGRRERRRYNCILVEIVGGVFFYYCRQGVGRLWGRGGGGVALGGPQAVSYWIVVVGAVSGGGGGVVGGGDERSDEEHKQEKKNVPRFNHSKSIMFVLFGLGHSPCLWLACGWLLFLLPGKFGIEVNSYQSDSICNIQKSHRKQRCQDKTQAHFAINKKKQ